MLLMTHGLVAQQEAPAPSEATTLSSPAAGPAIEQARLDGTSLAETTPGATLPEAPSATLPEAPGAAAAGPDFSSSASLSTAAPAADAAKAGNQYPKSARASDVTVLPGQIAPKQTARDKFVGSARDAFSPFTFAGEVLSGSYSHLTNGSPNFGSGIASYGQRVGSAVARGTSQNLFYEGATATIFREDPRYYVMGSGHPFFKRLVYAGTRPLITRTDGGRRTPNLALLTGYLGAAALTKVYYPPLNQGFGQTLQTYGGSIGGAAIGYVVSEFLSDALQIVHLKKGD